METLLYKRSGLLGLSGISNDMRDLLKSEEPGAQLAIDYFVYRAAKEIGALAAVLGGIDALVFTAGIGENSPEVRRRIVEASAWLGLDLDPDGERPQLHANHATGKRPRSGDSHQRGTDHRQAYRDGAGPHRGPRVSASSVSRSRTHLNDEVGKR